MDKKQIIELIRANEDIGREELYAQALQSGISDTTFAEIWDEMHPHTTKLKRVRAGVIVLVTLILIASLIIHIKTPSSEKTISANMTEEGSE